MYVIGKEEAAAAARVIESGRLFRYRGGEGGETDQFEAAWASCIGSVHCIAMANGTAALTCALAGMGVGPGDEVIVPAYTWIATALAPVAVGAIPVLAEVDESLTLDPADVERKITSRTKAIIPVHICGFPCAMAPLLALAERRGVLVLEDACQADGGSYRGKRLGSLGTAGAFSFNQFKIITCGEGGALVTNDEEVYQRALVQHDAGAVFRAYADELHVPFFAGTNFRINEVLSAILRVQLGRLDGILAALRREKRVLNEALAAVPGFALNPSHDAAGDCGTTVPLLFETPEDATRFILHMGEQAVTVDSPINSNYHVYTNWTPVLEQRGAHHPGRDPFKLCGYDITYAKDMCPATLTNLARTVYLGTEVDRPEKELLGLIEIVKRAAGR